MACTFIVSAGIFNHVLSDLENGVEWTSSTTAFCVKFGVVDDNLSSQCRDTVLSEKDH
jgi:hypothetical protein